MLFGYVPYLMNLFYNIMTSGEGDVAQKAIKLMESYDLQPEHLKEHLPELIFTKGQKNIYTMIPSK